MLLAFPLTDLSSAKVRPAAVVSRPIGEDVVLAFISSRLESVDRLAEHVISPEDAGFTDTGLRTASIVRLNKLATLHHGLVRRRLGRLSSSSRSAVAEALRYVFELDRT